MFAAIGYVEKKFQIGNSEIPIFIGNRLNQCWIMQRVGNVTALRNSTQTERSARAKSMMIILSFCVSVVVNYHRLSFCCMLLYWSSSKNVTQPRLTGICFLLGMNRKTHCIFQIVREDSLGTKPTQREGKGCIMQKNYRRNLDGIIPEATIFLTFYFVR